MENALALVCLGSLAGLHLLGFHRNMHQKTSGAIPAAFCNFSGLLQITEPVRFFLDRGTAAGSSLVFC